MNKETALDYDKIRARAIRLANETGHQMSNFKGHLRNSVFSGSIRANAATIRGYAANLRKYADKFEALATNLERTLVPKYVIDVFDDFDDF